MTKEERKKLLLACRKISGETMGVPPEGQRLSTGITLLDFNLGQSYGTYGIEANKPILIHGKQAVCKSHLLYRISANCQQAGGHVCLAVPENSFCEKKFMKHGGSIDDTLMMWRPRTIEETFHVWDTFVKGIPPKDGPILLGLDTLAGLCTAAEAKKKITEAPLAMHIAGKMAQWFRNTDYFKRPDVNKPVYLVWLQQNRDSTAATNYGPVEDRVPGGRALSFYVSAQIEMSLMSRTAAKEAGEKLTDEEKKKPETYKNIKFKFIKNRFMPVGRTVLCPMSYAKGWQDKLSCWIFLVGHGFVAKTANHMYELFDVKLYYKDWVKLLHEDEAMWMKVREYAIMAYEQEYFPSDEEEEEDVSSAE